MFKQLLFIVSIVFSIGLKGQAPAWQWAKSAASTAPEIAWDVACDQTTGDSYVVGSFNGNLSSIYGASFSSSNGVKDGFVAKYDQNGAVVWAIKIGGTGDEEAKSVAVDGSGNVYVTGNFKSTTDFDPSAATATLTPITGTGNNECFLAKYTSAGTFLWAVHFGSSNEEDINRVSADDYGVYVTGSYKTSITFYSSNAVTKTSTANDNDKEFFGAKYNLSGVAQWVIAGAGNKDDIGYDVTADINNVYFTGTYNQPMDVYNASGNAVASLQDQGGNKPNAFILAFSQAGAYVWSNNIVSNDDVFGYGIGQDGANIYVTGSFKNTTSFKYPSAQFTKTSQGATDIFVAQLAKSDGDFNWVSSQTGSGTGEEWGYAVKVNVNGDVIVASSFKNTLNYSAFGGPNLTTSGNEDIVLTAYTPFGDFAWVKQVLGTGKDFPHGVAIDSNNAIYLAGEYENALTFGSIVISPGNGTNIFVAKTVCSGAIPNNSITSSQNVCIGNVPATLIGSAVTGSSYEWKMSVNSTTWTNAAGNYTTQNYTPPAVSTSLFYKRDITGACYGTASSSTVMIVADQLPSIANAGVSQTVCGTQCTLNASLPSVGSGSWAVKNGTATITSTNNNKSTVSNLNTGITVFEWKVNNGNCPSSTATVAVFGDSPIPALAGTDKQLCQADTITMRANNASGYGKWSLLSGNGNYSNINDPNSFISGLNFGTNSFMWTITKPNCPVQRDTIIIKRDPMPSTPIAGDDQTTEKSSVQLNATTPSIGNGKWSVLEGSAEFENVNDPTTIIKHIAFGTNRLAWTVSNEGCAGNFDEITVFVKPLNVPNGFSPNSDGINDAFVITSLDYFTNVKFSVFNRWGAVLYQTEAYKNDWKGTNSAGEKLVDDTYYYVLDIPEYKTLTGFIVIKQNR